MTRAMGEYGCSKAVLSLKRHSTEAAPLSPLGAKQSGINQHSLGGSEKNTESIGGNINVRRNARKRLQRRVMLKAARCEIKLPSYRPKS